MSNNIKIIDGGICAVEGVRAAGSRVGKYGLAVVESKDSDASAVFTSNKVVAAPVIHTREMIKGGKISLVVANSGNANCFTGEEGIGDCKKTIDFASNLTSIPVSEIATASTGVIGRKMPMDTILPLVEESISKLDNSSESSTNAAKSLMTTDTYHKEFAVQTTLKTGEIITIGGITKGVGMIAPNMGTMLCFLATDAKISSEYINKALKIAVNKSFNMIVVDGDESTNDMAILMANGKSGAEVVNDGEIDENFQEALNFICISLAKKMARDGEGATKFIECKVNGAKSEDDAIKASKSVISSSLVKSAIFGGDPNWGRIAAAVGYSGAEMDQTMITIAVSDDGNESILVNKGEILAFDGTESLINAEKIMQEKTVNIFVDLYQGDFTATAWGCDLTYDYVKINAEYTT